MSYKRLAFVIVAVLALPTLVFLGSSPAARFHLRYKIFSLRASTPIKAFTIHYNQLAACSGGGALRPNFEQVTARR